MAGVLASGGVSASEAASDAAQEARIYLLRYVGLTSTADVAAVDLYRDDAHVRIATMVDGRETRASVVDGKRWKQQLRAGWFDGSTRLEASSFEGASVTTEGNRLLIRARRYSHTRCYWDNSYAVAIEPDRAGQLHIVEERINFERSTLCSDKAQQAAPQATGVVSPTVAAQANAATTIGPTVVRAALPPNVVPSGQGIPRLPAAMGTALTPRVAPAPASVPTKLVDPSNQHR